MKETFVVLLERKRAELKLGKAEFAKERLGLGKSERVAYSYYCQILAESRSFPSTRYKEAAKALGLTLEETTRLIQVSNARCGRKSRLAEVMLSADDLRYLASIAEAAGGKLPLTLLLEHLSHKGRRS